MLQRMVNQSLKEARPLAYSFHQLPILRYVFLARVGKTRESKSTIFERISETFVRRTVKCNMRSCSFFRGPLHVALVRNESIFAV